MTKKIVRTYTIDHEALGMLRVISEVNNRSMSNYLSFLIKKEFREINQVRPHEVSEVIELLSNSNSFSKISDIVSPSNKPTSEVVFNKLSICFKNCGISSLSI